MTRRTTTHRTIVLVLMAALGAATAHAEIGIYAYTDAASPGTTAGFSSLTFQHPISSQANRVLIVAACRESNDVNPELDIQSVTYNGTAMTQVSGASVDLVEETVGASNDIYYMLEADLPAAGSYDVVITLPGNASWICSGALSLDYAAQQPPEAAATGSVTDDVDPTITTNITTWTDGAWLVDAVMCGSGAENGITPEEFVTTVAGMEKLGVAIAQSAVMAMAYQPVPTAGQASMGWQKVGDAFRMAHSIIALAPAPPDDPNDLDDDGLSNDDETNIYNTDPEDADSDDDGLNDYDEVFWNGDPDLDAYHPSTNPTGTDTDPNEPDTDGDGMSDGDEVRYGSSPNDPNSVAEVQTTNYMGLILLGALLLHVGAATIYSRRPLGVQI